MFYVFGLFQISHKPCTVVCLDGEPEGFPTAQEAHDSFRADLPDLDPDLEWVVMFCDDIEKMRPELGLD